MRTQTLSKTLLLAVLLLAPACNGGEPETPSPTPAIQKTRAAAARIDTTPKPIPVKAKAVMEAKWGGKKLNTTIHGSVVSAAKERGEVAAMGVCVDTKVASEIHKLKGVTVGRSSLRLRNPHNAGPKWVQEFLKKDGEQKTVDLKSITEIVDVDGVQTAHFLRRIRVEKGCLGCHGAKADLAPDVVAHLAKNYPQDKAVGYSEGELRGVVWGEIAVEQRPVDE
jgi:hypothetical protein